MVIAARLGEQPTVPLIRPPIVAPTALRLVIMNMLRPRLVLPVSLLVPVRISIRWLPMDRIRSTRPDLVPIRPLVSVLCVMDSMDSCLVPSTVVVSRVPRRLTRWRISLANCLDLPETWLEKHPIVLGLLVVLLTALVSRETVFVGAPSLREMPAMKLCCTTLKWCRLSTLETKTVNRPLVTRLMCMRRQSALLGSGPLVLMFPLPAPIMFACAWLRRGTASLCLCIMSLAEISPMTLWTLVSVTVRLRTTLKCCVVGDVHRIAVSELMIIKVLGTMVISRCLADRMGMWGLNRDVPPVVLNRSGLPGLMLLRILRKFCSWLSRNVMMNMIMVMIINVVIIDGAVSTRLNATCLFLDNF